MSSSLLSLSPKRLLVAQLTVAALGFLVWWSNGSETIIICSLAAVVVLAALMWRALDASSNPVTPVETAVSPIVLTAAVDSISPPPSDDPYERIEQLGEGNMGEVWRARHRRLGRMCAIKQVRADLMSKQQVARFIREARVTAQLCSPHTVSVHDFGILPDGSLFYAMELLEGIDLQSCVRRFGVMKAERVVHILVQACHSLEEAHRAGLVHRDLKPANLMLCHYGLDYDFVKIVDFGLAKETVEPGATRLTLDNTVLGTAAYLAPESLKGSTFVDGRADIYALGCLAFWLLTAELLFAYDHPVTMAKAHVADQPRRVIELAPDVPLELDALIACCLAKNPEERPQSAAELAQRLLDVPLRTAWTTKHANNWWLEHQFGSQS